DAAPTGQTLVAVPLPAGSTTVSVLALDATGREGRPWRAPAPFERPGLEPVGPADDPWREVRNVKDGSILVRVPPTERFVMGTDDLTEGGVRFDPGATPERYRPHAVTLSRGFYLGRVEVTRAQVDRWHLEARGHVRPERPLVIVRDGWRRGEFPLRDDEPAVQVSWHDARAYCEWAGLRLPTEAEWEWAARGPQGFPFPWGTTLPEDAPAGNLSEGTPQLGGHDGYAFLAPVGSYPRGASWCRALDLSGNVSEWVADWFGAFGPEPLVDPVGPPDGRRRVVRGGSWDNTFDMNRAYVRMAFAPEQRDITIGFRVAADAPP
ncbi:MAG: formylglycine-generating enzyme family protein, partial [Planctomycetota bacterium]|nr:formylglycine-generating enzyme family protein [Planctomycetota bacterium]